VYVFILSPRRIFSNIIDRQPAAAMGMSIWCVTLTSALLSISAPSVGEHFSNIKSPLFLSGCRHPKFSTKLVNEKSTRQKVPVPEQHKRGTCYENEKNSSRKGSANVFFQSTDPELFVQRERESEKRLMVKYLSSFVIIDHFACNFHLF
jgi:hypothetical protein